jgi:divalent metal cation (Fe/Co/Zn/Cd) transporter
MRKEAESVAGVIRVDECRVRKSSLGMFVDMQVRVDGNLTVFRRNETAEEVAARLKASPLGIAGVMVHVEPGLVEEPRPVA